MSLVAVKYIARPMALAVLLEYRVPIDPTTLSAAQISRLNDAFEGARRILEAERDLLAGEVRERGVCPWGCGNAPHDPETACLPTPAAVTS